MTSGNKANRAEYWQKKKNLKLFSKYEDGIRVNDVMRYSVTKEQIAHKIAADIAKKGYYSVVDACGGAGGNTIAFALFGMNVACVELDENNLEDAIHNCEVYEVTENVYFHQGNILEFNCEEDAGLDPKSTFFFSSPEWGGPEYKNSAVFDLEKLNPPLSKLLEYIKTNKYPEAAVYVPRTSNIEQAEQMGCVKFEYMYLQGWCDAVCLWFKFD